MTPTSAVVMGGLARSRIGYDRCIGFGAPYQEIMFVLAVVSIGLGAIVGGEAQPVARAAVAASPLPSASPAS